jgi:hypothetical protein
MCDGNTQYLKREREKYDERKDYFPLDTTCFFRFLVMTYPESVDVYSPFPGCIWSLRRERD